MINQFCSPKLWPGLVIHSYNHTQKQCDSVPCYISKCHPLGFVKKEHHIELMKMQKLVHVRFIEVMFFTANAPHILAYNIVRPDNALDDLKGRVEGFNNSLVTLQKRVEVAMWMDNIK